jgi:hypothetical protein
MNHDFYTRRGKQNGNKLANWESVLFTLSRDGVTIDGVRISNWIYWTLKIRDYK